MKKYIFVGVGGFLGAILRFEIKSIQDIQSLYGIPLDTLIINITGSFILALFLTIFLKRCKINPDISLGISTGFLGAFTTFSTFCKEVVSISSTGKLLAAFIYITASIIFGLFGVYLGSSLGKKVSS